MTEVIIYHVYNKAQSSGMDAFPVTALPHETGIGLASRAASWLRKLALAFAAAGVLLIVINYAPLAIAWAGNGFNLAFKSNINLSQSEAQNITQNQASPRSTYQPAFNPRLPLMNRLIIPTIGVNTDIEEATYDNYESALKNGVWRVSDFGQPNANSMPTILAAHRYGYLAWTNLFRRENSFYNLPKLNVGDTVEIDWNQRHYVYEIYAGAEGDSITDYSADLILYTCVDLTGPERIFRYAKLIKS